MAYALASPSILIVRSLEVSYTHTSGLMALNMRGKEGLRHPYHGFWRASAADVADVATFPAFLFIFHPSPVIHIGSLIRSVFDSMSKQHSIDWFAQQLNCHRRNVYDIFSRQNIDIQLLDRIGKILDHNFFDDLADAGNADCTTTKPTTPDMPQQAKRHGVPTGDISRYLATLLRLVESRAGIIMPLGPKAFEALSDEIFNATGSMISASTLKRLWGYSRPNNNTRRSTLDILARYAGYANFAAFTRKCDSDSGVDSGYTSGAALTCSTLAPDTLVELSWHPGRVVRLRCTGDCEFVVEESILSKIKAGMRLRCSVIVNGHPLMADVAPTGDNATFRPYVCGQSGGVAWHIIALPI